MHLDEEVKPVAQKHLVLNWGHAVEKLEELLLLLGGRWKHVLRLNVIELVWQVERAIGGSGLGLASEEVNVGLVLDVMGGPQQGSKEGPKGGWACSAGKACTARG